MCNVWALILKVSFTENVKWVKGNIKINLVLYAYVINKHVFEYGIWSTIPGFTTCMEKQQQALIWYMSLSLSYNDDDPWTFDSALIWEELGDNSGLFQWGSVKMLETLVNTVYLWLVSVWTEN